MVSFQFCVIGYVAGLISALLLWLVFPVDEWGLMKVMKAYVTLNWTHTRDVVSSRDFQLYAAPLHLCQRGGAGRGEDDDHRHGRCCHSRRRWSSHWPPRHRAHPEWQSPQDE
eukprot:1059772-Pyramimonas_sp.AAC.1